MDRQAIMVDCDGSIIISHETLAEWAGLTEDELTRDVVSAIVRALPHSSVPDAIAEIVGGLHTDHSDTRICQGIGCRYGGQ